LASQLGYAMWSTMASGLPYPTPRPNVNVSIGVTAASVADIVVELNRQAKDRAIVVLDPHRRFIGVVYYG
jgi:hypothetical protein